MVNSRNIECSFEEFFAETFILLFVLKSFFFFFLNLKLILEPFYYITVNGVVGMITILFRYVLLCTYYVLFIFTMADDLFHHKDKKILKFFTQCLLIYT